jgi:hypothetical protein
MYYLEDTIERMSSTQRDAVSATVAQQPKLHLSQAAAGITRSHVPPSQHASSSAPNQRNQVSDHGEVVMDLDSDPGAIPGFYIATSPESISTSRDIVSRGTITFENAEKYFHTYRDRLDHFPYRILGNHSKSSLEVVRKASPLLALAVCTVGALHLASDDFKPCYREFVSTSVARGFSKGCNIDDVRALCIGAFWLSDLSWTLVSAAVRIATELQFHKSMS